MGLFSKLVKDVAEAAADKKWEDAVEKVRSNEKLKDLTAKVKAGVDVLESEMASRAERFKDASEAEDTMSAGAQSSGLSSDPADMIGKSYGSVMPEEDNQYKYDGPFWKYFEDIFRKEFPDHPYVKEEIKPLKCIVYTFYSGDEKTLFVELLSENFYQPGLIAAYETSKIPYLRFYIDHNGWWNTRSYVISRISKVLA